MLGNKKLHDLLARIQDVELELQAELGKLDNESPMRWDPRWYEARADIKGGVCKLVQLYGAEKVQAEPDKW